MITASRSGLTAVLASCAAGAALLLLAIPASAAVSSVRVIDGDTFVIDGETVRIEGVDAPELHRAKCLAERMLAQQAKQALTGILDRCPVSLDRHGRDRYGRTVARVTACGRDVGTALMVGQVAAPWEHHAVDWCGPP
jgi:endonuclease YncB( thermonuclease family)